MISHIYSHIHHIKNSDSNDKMPKILEYIQGLEEERRKIQVFERELPLCLQLVTQAIEECKQSLLGKEGEYNKPVKSNCSEQTSTEGPILEEFIPLKRNSSSDYDEQYSQNSEKIKNKNKVHGNNDKSVSKKSEWLRSAQLWNQTPDPPPTEKISPKRVSVMEVNRNGSGGAFHPFKREKTVGRSYGPLQPSVTGKCSPAPAAAASSTAETGGSNGCKSKKGEKESESQKKSRRSWSPELHKRFLQALQQLGGSSVATPKQIRELMMVDGLTNDEVKSHLQKYRLHNRRSIPSINTSHPQQPQFVVVGGIWVPPPEYGAAMVTTTNSGEATSNEIYAPIATLATPFQEESASETRRHLQHKVSSPVSQDSNCRGGGGGRVDSDHNSQAWSSSTDTTTTTSLPDC